jgi:hypothetical protein
VVDAKGMQVPDFPNIREALPFRRRDGRLT